MSSNSMAVNNAPGDGGGGGGQQVAAAAPQGVKYVCGECGAENLLRARVRNGCLIACLTALLDYCPPEKELFLSLSHYVCAGTGAMQTMWLSNSLQDADAKK